DVKLRYTLDQMYDMFKNAPVLGSLLNPTRIAEQSYWTRENYQRALELVQKIMSREKGDYEKFEMGVVAQGIAKATTLLAEKYHFVVTNVPYLARGKQDEALKEFCQEYYKEAKNDLATVFLDRCLEFCINNNLVNQGQDRRQGVSSGNVSAVFPQNWLFLTSYKKFREKLLKQDVWQLIARLGPGAFETISGEVVKAILLSISRSLKIEKPSTLMLKKDMLQDAHSNMIRGLDVSDFHPAQEKAKQIYEMDINSVEQVKQLDNPDATIKLGNRSRFGIVRDFANCFQGLTTGDDLRLKRLFWEFIQNSDNYTYWQLLQAPSHGRSLYGGRHNLVDVRITTGELKTGALRGKDAWGKWGIAIDRVGSLSPAIYCGDYFHSLVPVIIPKFKVNLSFFLSFAKSSTLKKVAEETNQALSVDNGYFEKFEFDLNHWSKVAQEEYPHGLPQPYSDDPTQWIFHGHPCGSVIWDEDKKWTAHGPLRIEANVLHVAVARLLGYRWPAELDPEMELADEQRWWVQKAGELLPLADEDGIVCIPPVRGEAAAADRLFEILVRSYGSEWSNNILNQLLTEAGNAGKTLESWLRDKFFAQHCRLFHHRPFIWHIWDGLRDGFSALVNYHRLDFKNLETLTYTYLGDWIARQKQAVSEGVDAAEEKLAAAESLKKKLELILEGENPYDIFVRWKPIEKQPIGWNPDLNDGVRLNIRPFMTVGDVSKKGAGILRDKPNIKWNKDRGKDVQSAPWYHLFKGERINDHHLNLQEKFKSRGNNNEYN
ncbi:MAG: SAM-dependent DNA methyltransferase, partial [Desulfonatronospira sp. MSAO_Bac3]